ncbi:MAG: hypothetical protein Q7T29_09680 [Gallionella sp.]|nr:hypothetical protein [Gallionella sp.]
MDFCRADSRTNTNTIHVLVINSGMINSPTLAKRFDVALFDQFSVAFEAIAHTRPVLVIDEPHLFKTDNKTFANIRNFKPQFTLRYGATFDGDFQNLVYQLNAVDAFNQDLVKGIVAHVETFDEGGNTTLKLIGLDAEASFELSQNGTKKTFKLAKKESLSRVHPAMSDLDVSEFNKSKLVLSNGLEMRKTLLSLANPRRFIFSKWTLREGWDNPNIFQICKLRSSGSETSKLQEVGRGLRLPVNEYMSRDKSKSHDLHYYVDFTEQDFIAKLTQEINDKSGAHFNLTKLDDALIKALLKAYPEFENGDEKLLETLGDAGIRHLLPRYPKKLH